MIHIRTPMRLIPASTIESVSIDPHCLEFLCIDESMSEYADYDYRWVMYETEERAYEVATLIQRAMRTPGEGRGIYLRLHSLGIGVEMRLSNETGTFIDCSSSSMAQQRMETIIGYTVPAHCILDVRAGAIP